MDDNTLHFKLTTGMKPFEYRLYAICDPFGWISELYKDAGHVRTSIKALNGFLRADLTA